MGKQFENIEKQNYLKFRKNLLEILRKRPNENNVLSAMATTDDLHQQLPVPARTEEELLNNIKALTVSLTKKLFVKSLNV